MKFRGREFSTGTTGNFQSELTLIHVVQNRQAKTPPMITSSLPTNRPLERKPSHLDARKRGPGEIRVVLQPLHISA